MEITEEQIQTLEKQVKENSLRQNLDSMNQTNQILLFKLEACISAFRYINSSDSAMASSEKAREMLKKLNND